MTPSIKSMPLEDPGRPEAHETPGRQLRALREARRLDIDRVAAQLHLQRQVIELIEGDQYDRLPAPVFVIGYIRNYARLFGADPTPMLAAYRALVPPSEPSWFQAGLDKGTAGRPDGSRRWVWAIALLGVGVAAGSGALWMRGQEDRMHALVAQTAQQTSGAIAPNPTAAVPPQAAPMPPAPPESIPLRDLPRSPSASSPPPGLSETVQTQTVAALSPIPNLAEVPAGALAAQPSVAAEGDEGEEDPQAQRPAAMPPTQNTATRGDVSLVFDFTGTSWVEVRNATGKLILSGKMRAGDRRVVQGEPPYRIVVGNASVTQLTVGGQPFDLKAHARGNVARFSLDPFQAASVAASQQAADQRAGRP